MQAHEAVALGALQGATEFLPVSSSGHLVLAGRLLGVTEPGVLVAASLHLGTLAAVVWFTRRELAALVLAAGPRGANRDLLVAVAIGTVPVVAAGLALFPFAERLFSSSRCSGIGLVGTSLVLLHSRAARGGPKTTPGSLDALLVGIAQAAALVPGVSRSGATIWAGMCRGMERERAAKFSFLLSIPATAGAAAAEMVRPTPSDTSSTFALLLGAAVAAVAGWIALHVLYRLVIQGRLWVFAPYCLGAGVLTLVVSRG